MESIKIKNLTYKYHSANEIALTINNLGINEGEFCCLFGASGSGKSTLLNLLVGKLDCEIDAIHINNGAVGFVGQNPELQIVCDKVWHELAFALESTGATKDEIRIAVGEVASFFGLEDVFYSDTATLSGGQKQLLNLASVMTTKPSILLLDEPTSQLDPIASDEFIRILKKLNDEFGTTILISEHRLDDVLHICDSVVLLNEGSVVAKTNPSELPKFINEACPKLSCALPAPTQIINSVTDKSPLSVKEGRGILATLPVHDITIDTYTPLKDEIRVDVDKVYARYERELDDVLKHLSLRVYKGEVVSVLGGNGSGKTTLLQCLQGNLKPYRGKITTNGKVVTMPQNPRYLFSEKSVYLDLFEACGDNERINTISTILGINHLLQKHPYDLSGGELQRACLAKLLLCGGDVFLLDEPTKGIDAFYKQELVALIRSLARLGKTFMIVSHDTDFLASVSDRCGLLFDGEITSINEPHTFFSRNNFYTTSTNKLMRGYCDNAITIAEGISALSGTPPKKVDNDRYSSIIDIIDMPKQSPNTKSGINKKLTITLGVVFVVSVLLGILFSTHATLLGTIAVVSFCGAVFINTDKDGLNVYTTKAKPPSTKTVLIIASSILLVALTILFGATVLADKKYYFISLLIILEATVPFLTLFENSKPTARELVTIAILSALAVGGRLAFYFIPNFKPQLAIVILAGVTLGGEVGFVCGLISAFVSNIFFGQGAWTPWQMFAFGIVGFISGLLFYNGRFKLNRFLLCIVGFICAFVIYGGIMDTATVFMMQAEALSIKMFLLTYAMGVKFNLIHAAATAFFLWMLSPIFVERINHLKIKYKLF